MCFFLKKVYSYMFYSFCCYHTWNISDFFQIFWKNRFVPIVNVVFLFPFMTIANTKKGYFCCLFI